MSWNWSELATIWERCHLPKQKSPFLPNGTIVGLDGFLLSSPSACLPFCLQSGGRGAKNKMEGKRKLSLSSIAPLEAATAYSTTTCFCWRTTFRNNCVVKNLFYPDICHLMFLLRSVSNTIQWPIWGKQMALFSREMDTHRGSTE